MTYRFLAGLSLALTLALAACGSSTGGDPGAATATAAIKAELLHQSASAASPFTFSETQAQCTASRVVEAVGTSSLQKYGLLNAKNLTTAKTLDDTTLSNADATAVVNAIIDCLGSGNFTNALAVAVGKNFQGAKTASQRACLQSKLTAALLKPMLIATLSGDQAAAATFATSLTACAPAK